MTEPAEVDLARAALARARSRARRRTPRADPTPRRSGAGPDGRDPILLGPALAGLLETQGWTEQAAVGVLMGQWEQIVGPDLAAHVSPETFDPAAGLLTLRCDSTAWATQVTFLIGPLRSKLAAVVGPDVVKAIKVTGPSAPSWRFGSRHVAGRGPRDTYG